MQNIESEKKYDAEVVASGKCNEHTARLQKAHTVSAKPFP